MFLDINVDGMDGLEAAGKIKADDIIYIETSKHKNVFCTAGETYSIILYHGGRGMGSIYFFDTFLKKKNIRRLQRCRYVYFQK